MGLVRMFAASPHQQVMRGARSMTFIVPEGFLLVAAVTITFKAAGCDAA